MLALLIKVKGLTLSTIASETVLRLFFVIGLLLSLATSPMAFAQSEITNQSAKEELISAIQNWVGLELNVASFTD